MFAALSSNVDAGTILAILGGIGALYYLVRLLRAQGTAAQLAAKDAVIETWEKSHSANEERIETLERKVAEFNRELATLKAENEKLRADYVRLERYAAPEAVKRFEAQQEVALELLRTLTHAG